MAKGALLPIPLFGIRAVVEKQRKVDVRVDVDLAGLPGPPGFLQGSWVQVQGERISGADIAAWPCSVSPLQVHWFSGVFTLSRLC